jgi:Flp pilus assembly protein TadD
MAIYADALRLHPDDVAALTGAGAVLLAQGRPDDARRRFEHALVSSGGDNKAALEGLLRAIRALPPERAMTALLSARTAAPTAPEIPTRLAFLQADSGKLREAAFSMGEAVRLEPGDLARRLDYALMLDRAGAERDALAAYSSFLADYRPGQSPALGVPLDSIRRRAAFLLEHAS